MVMVMTIKMDMEIKTLMKKNKTIMEMGLEMVMVMEVGTRLMSQMVVMEMTLGISFQMVFNNLFRKLIIPIFKTLCRACTVMKILFYNTRDFSTFKMTFKIITIFMDSTANILENPNLAKYLLFISSSKFKMVNKNIILILILYINYN